MQLKMSEDYKIFDIISEFKPTHEQEKYSFTDNPRYAVWLSNSLQMTCFEKDLVAISSPQVGINNRSFYIYGFESAFFNPIIVDESTTTSYLDEYSSSYHGLVLNIKRPDTIRIRWTNALGETRTDIFTGITSRIIQRKLDYLNGIDFLSRATKFHRDKAIKNYKEFQVNQQIIKNEKDK